MPRRPFEPELHTNQNRAKVSCTSEAVFAWAVDGQTTERIKFFFTRVLNNGDHDDDHDDSYRQGNATIDICKISKLCFSIVGYKNPKRDLHSMVKLFSLKSIEENCTVVVICNFGKSGRKARSPRKKSKTRLLTIWRLFRTRQREERTEAVLEKILRCCCEIFLESHRKLTLLWLIQLVNRINECQLSQTLVLPFRGKRM